MKSFVLKMFLPLALAGGGVFAVAAPPQWWSQGNPPVIDPLKETDHFALANIGQTKWMAKNALEALRQVDPATAAAVEADLIGPGKPLANWDAPVTAEQKTAQKSPLLIGQLKAISAPFYDHLHAANASWLENERVLNGTAIAGTHYPWTPETTDDSNKAVANTGQLKAVFSLRFETYPPVGDAYEQWAAGYFPPGSGIGRDDDPDGDGLTNEEEFLLGTSPVDIDTDHDGIPDGSDSAPLVPEVTGNSIAAIVVLTPLR